MQLLDNNYYNIIDFVKLNAISKLALRCKDPGYLCVSKDGEEIVGGYTGS